MIKPFYKTLAGTKVLFGYGTVRIRGYAVKSRPVGHLELTTCRPTPLGEVPPHEFCGGPKVVLEFTNKESIEILIDRLRKLKELM